MGRTNWETHSPSTQHSNCKGLKAFGHCYKCSRTAVYQLNISSYTRVLTRGCDDWGGKKAKAYQREIKVNLLAKVTSWVHWSRCTVEKLESGKQPNWEVKTLGVKRKLFTWWITACLWPHSQECLRYRLTCFLIIYQVETVRPRPNRIHHKRQTTGLYFLYDGINRVRYK